jgi:hypothetical protein
MSTATITRTSLKEFRAQLADDALAWRDRKSGDHCGDCAQLAIERCPECIADEEMAGRYKAIAWAVDGAADDIDPLEVFRVAVLGYGGAS